MANQTNQNHRVECIEYNEQWEPIVVERFAFAEDAIAWAHTRQPTPGPLVEADTQIGIELHDTATEAAIEAGTFEGNPLPGHPIWQFSGFDATTGEARELEDEDWRNA